MKSERRLVKLRCVLEHRQPDLTVVIENIHDPHNVSAILRSADAVGVCQVQLVYTREKFARLGRKSSASAQKWVGRRKFTCIEECYAALRNEGYNIYATHIGDMSGSVYELNLTEKVALVFGNEHRGVSEAAVKLADAPFMIPMRGMIQSLNVSVACAVSLYEAMRQRLGAGQYRKPKYSAQRLDQLMDEWKRK
ncbi:MAG: TrmH family RNA methyltransferase [Bacteroidota bacterium]